MDLGPILTLGRDCAEMDTFITVMGSILLILAIGLFWWNIRLLRGLRFRKAQVELSLAGMVEELEAVTQQGVERIRQEREQLEQLLAVAAKTGRREPSGVRRRGVAAGDTSGATQSQKCRAIMQLAQAGLGPQDIAKQLGIGRGEVQLALGVAGYREQGNPDSAGDQR